MALGLADFAAPLARTSRMIDKVIIYAVGESRWPDIDGLLLFTRAKTRDRIRHKVNNLDWLLPEFIFLYIHL